MRIRSWGAGFLLFFIVANLSTAMAYADAPSVMEIYVNGNDRSVSSIVTVKNDGIWISNADLTEAGIKTNTSEINHDGFVNLTSLSGVQVQINSTEQKLAITADDKRLIPQAFDLRPQNSALVSNASSGFIGKYDIVSTVNDLSHVDHSTTNAATLGGNYFSSLGNLMSNGFVQQGTGTSQLVRLDTAAEFDEPDLMRRWMAGDAITGGPTWARSVRIGGLQIARDFSMRPDLATFPLPSFFGQTAVPTTVDVFVNSARVFESNVEPGPFQITNLPIITGGGTATVVTRDVLGRETTATLPFFASSSLLRQGLDSYDADIGFIRTSYGQKSFGYGQAATSGTYSKGMSDWLTLETHGEATKTVQQAGGGAIFSLSPYGIVHAASAVSTNTLEGNRHNGFLNSLSFQSQLNPFDLFASAAVTNESYADIASVSSTVPPKAQFQTGASVGFDRAGSLTVSWIDLKNKAQNDSQLLTGSYALSLYSRWNLALTSLYDRSNGSYVAEASLSFFFGNGTVASASSRSGSQPGQDVGFIKPVNPDGGFGYKAYASRGDIDTKQLEGTWIASHASLDAQVADTKGVQGTRFDLSGGVVAMDGSIYATKTPNNAVALIHTGEAGSTVYRENRPVATADDDGNALLTDLIPYTANRISIDPTDYSLATVIDKVDQNVIPARQQGVIVDFTPPHRAPVLIVLQRDDGSYPPVGSGVTLDSNEEPLIVGHHGEVFIPDLPQPDTGVVDYGNGTCIFTVLPPFKITADTIPRMGPLACTTQRPP